MIELRHLEKKYETVTPLRDVNTVINDGDVISVIGSSGAGKSTLLRCINMLERPTGGQILFDGVDITDPKYNVTLARRRMGKTMLIVTHEMNFARAICNRVFFLSQGGIYEDGTPEQIFDDPQRDLTRRFIRRLKVMELKIDSSDFDFIGAGNEIDQYCLRNNIPSRIKYRIRLAFEELTQQMLFPVLKHTPVMITIEYSEAESQAIVIACYGGDRYDPSEDKDNLSYSVLKGTAEELSYAYCEEEELSNTIRVVIRERAVK